MNLDDEDIHDAKLPTKFLQKKKAKIVSLIFILSYYPLILNFSSIRLFLKWLFLRNINRDGRHRPNCSFFFNYYDDIVKVVKLLKNTFTFLGQACLATLSITANKLYYI